MTRDELKEKVARAICASDFDGDTAVYDEMSAGQRANFTRNATAVLSAIEAASMAVVPVDMLSELVGDEVYSAYHAGIAVNGEWMDGGRSEGRWLRHHLGLEDGRHPEKSVWDALPDLVERRVKELQVGAMIEAGRLK